MKYEVLESFSGVINAHRGEIIEITDKAISKDLLTAGYIKKAGSKVEPSDVEAQ